MPVSPEVNLWIFDYTGRVATPPKRGMSQHPNARDEVSRIEFAIWNLLENCREFGNVQNELGEAL